MGDNKLKSIPKHTSWSLEENNERGMGLFHYQLGGRSHKWHPPTDVYETDDAIIVRVEIAGMNNSEFSISYDDNILSIQGSRYDQEERLAFHQMEVRFGEFITEVGMHWAIDTQAIDANYKDGFLRLVLPKLQPHKVKID